MITRILSDSEIGDLISEPKSLPDGLRPLGKQAERNQHRRREFEIVGSLGNVFMLATRQNVINSFDFSVILGFKMTGLNTIFRLRRYNGKSHEHTNVIENETFRDFHMHRATERYQLRDGSKEDHFATVDKRYYSLESAIECLLDDCGFPSDPQMKFFKGAI